MMLIATFAVKVTPLFSLLPMMFRHAMPLITPATLMLPLAAATPFQMLFAADATAR